jgi:hypothetical protein
MNYKILLPVIFAVKSALREYPQTPYHAQVWPKHMPLPQPTPPIHHPVEYPAFVKPRRKQSRAKRKAARKINASR